MSAGLERASGIEAFLSCEERRDLLRFVICGSVDDGKSTLLGRLLRDTNQVCEDQIQETAEEVRVSGKHITGMDLAFLVDGLQDEREQGITIDVAYRYFGTAKRKFIVADTPGHEQYTRNMATGASTADLAVILVDAQRGIVSQTRRHACIATLVGIRQAILIVNKMDLVEYDEAPFRSIYNEFAVFAEKLGIQPVHAIPVSATEGENVLVSRGCTPWYDGPSLMRLLESVDASPGDPTTGLRLPVQRGNRPAPDFRGYSGTIASGVMRTGMQVKSSLSGNQSRVARILGPSGDLDAAFAGQAVTVVLTDEIDISRGDIIAGTQGGPEVADQFAADLLWMDGHPLLPERPYWIQIGTASATAQITDIVYRLDVNTLGRLAAKDLKQNEIGYCKLSLDRLAAFDPFSHNRNTGGFVLVDKFTNATVAAGMIRFGLRRASNVVWRRMKIDKATRARAKGQTPRILWFTGLSGAGKSTIADRLEQELAAAGRHTYVLDGDNVRHGLSRDLGFTDPDRVENIRRVAEAARLMLDAGLIVIVSFISPFRSERAMARSMVSRGEFIEVFVDAPLEVCEERDPKGLYQRARAGKLPNFTGIDSAYEPPNSPEILLKSAEHSPDELVEQVVRYLRDIEEC